MNCLMPLNVTDLLGFDFTTLDPLTLVGVQLFGVLGKAEVSFTRSTGLLRTYPLAALLVAP